MPSLFNLANFPPWKIGSWEFNDAPEPVEIDGVRSTNRCLFSKLEAEEEPMRRAEIFNEYLSVRHNLHEWRHYDNDARRSLRNSYVRYLRGWGVDSNSVEGAVLKGWVESRLGLHPTYHRGALGPSEGEADLQYAVDRMKGSARTNAIFAQLDLLYEFCQYELRRRNPGQTHFTLFRGTFDRAGYRHIEERSRRDYCVELNNLSSFTAQRETAWEFGSAVWRVDVPLAKIFFFSGLLPDSLLKGEDEFMVIGGQYWVKELLY